VGWSSSNIIRAVWIIGTFFALSGATLNSASASNENVGAKAQGVTDALQAAATVASAIRETIQPVESDEGCDHGQDRRNSDLCAQWKAADAARDAADYAWWALLIGTIGTGAVALTLYYTRKAVLAAELATSDAERALAVAAQNAAAATKLAAAAEATAERQLRAYLSVQAITLDEDEWDQHRRLITIDMKNAGQTPADLTSVHLMVTWGYNEGSSELIQHTSKHSIRCHRGTPIQMPFGFSTDVGELENPGMLTVVGRVEYLDVFGKPRKEPFSFRSPSGADGLVALHEHELPMRLSAFSAQTILDFVERTSGGDFDAAAEINTLVKI